MLLVICFSFLLSISATCLGCLWPLVISFLQRHLQFLPQMKIRELLLPDLTRFLKNLIQMGHLQLLEKLKVYLLMFQQSLKLKANTWTKPSNHHDTNRIPKPQPTIVPNLATNATTRHWSATSSPPHTSISTSRSAKRQRPTPINPLWWRVLRIKREFDWEEERKSEINSS